MEDDPNINELIKLYAEQEGFRVLSARTGTEGLDLALSTPVDCVVLDRMLPEMEGLEVMKAIRQKKSVPIILVTAKSGEIDKVLGLELGADDYVSKPFSPKELIARIKAVLRRSGGAPSVEGGAPTLQHKDLSLNHDNHTLIQGEKLIPLSVIEFQIMEKLMQQPGRVFSRDDLMLSIYNSQAAVYDRTIDAHIKNLRRKLGDKARKPNYIASIHGVGYKLLAQT